jgi:orotate phosphoribosyltransferase
MYFCELVALLHYPSLSLTMTEREIAASLLAIKAVKLNVNQPFTWASGWQSPIYCDNRLTLSFPDVRTAITTGFVEKIRATYPTATGIAGVATGAIAYGALVADVLGLPFVYIRSSAKAHGLGNMVEGDVRAAESYVVIEDLISTGGSSAKAVQALQAAGVAVLGTVAIFSYGFPHASETFAATNTSFDTLTHFGALLPLAVASGYITADEVATIEQWQQSPATWRS